MRSLFQKALKLTLPVMAGYLFLGFAFGILCQKEGLGWPWAMLISCTVYAGSMQFVLLNFLHGNTQLLEIAFVTLSVNARQLFYGISFIQTFKNMGWRKWYMIFSLTDETYSLLCSLKGSEKQTDKNLLFLVSLCNQIYWIVGSIIGAVMGNVLPFDATGIDFAMTALFTVIFVEQWLTSKTHKQVYVALLSAGVAMLLFQRDFLLPALIITTILLCVLENYVSKEIQEYGE